MNKTFGIKACILCNALFLVNAHAGVVIGATRVIYNAGDKDTAISINNPDHVPYLIQTWVDKLDGNKNNIPFIVTPPLYRLNGGKQSTMRIVYSGTSLPEDRESLFLLNIKSIPSAPEEDGNVLQVSVKAKMKLLYRPHALKNKSPEDYADQLRWRVTANKLTVDNPTPFYMNFGEVNVGHQKVKKASFVAPYSNAEFPLTSVESGAVTFNVINDYGGMSKEFRVAN